MIDFKDTTATITEPLDLGIIKSHLRVDGNGDDGYIESLISASREKAEQITGRSLVAHSFEYETNENDGEVRLLYPPVGTVTKVEYWDGDEWQEFESDDYDLHGLNMKWVEVSEDYSHIKVSYGTTADSNSDLKRLMMDLIQVWYDNRPDADMLQEKIVNRMAKHRIWQAS